jgi:hypothetical protein
MSEKTSALRLEQVCETFPNPFSAKIVNLWIRNNALTYTQACDRVSHAVCALVCETSGEVVGVSTARLAYFPETTDKYYFYGVYVDPHYRGQRPWLLKRSYDILNRSRTDKAAKGVAVVVENKRIPLQIFSRYGWQRRDHFSISSPIFCKNFDAETTTN